MHTTNLRKAGGSVMLAVPRPILDLLRLEAGAAVGLSVEQGCLIIEPAAKPRYTLEALAQCDPDAAMSQEDRDWLDLTPSGREL
jgi:antitoxin ChpS